MPTQQPPAHAAPTCPRNSHLPPLLCLQAHLAPVTSVSQVLAVVNALLQNNKIRNASHNMMAYRIHMSEKNTFLQVGGRLSRDGHIGTWRSLGLRLAGHVMPSG
jgi:hypothetical protein